MRNQIEKEHRSSTTNTGTNRLNNSPTAKNAERERSRVRSLRNAFHVLQTCLPTVPPDTKLSKLDILILATNYIAQLTNTLDNDDSVEHSTMAQSINISPIKSGQKLKYYHPIKVNESDFSFLLFLLMEIY